MQKRDSILVLDDSQDLLDVMRDFCNYLCSSTAVTARSLRDIDSLGEKALQCKVALLDINLGVNQPTGIDVYRWLRRNGFSGPIFFLTGHTLNSSAIEEAERLGDARVLTKPILPEHL